MSATKPAIWTRGDWNAFFGFGTNILVNLLTLSGLLRFVLKMPEQLVFGRILPATGMMLFLSTVYYAWLAYKLAKQTGRSDVCALPSGVSVPHMFVVTFVIMLPIASIDIMNSLNHMAKTISVKRISQASKSSTSTPVPNLPPPDPVRSPARPRSVASKCRGRLSGRPSPCPRRWRAPRVLGSLLGSAAELRPA